MSEVLTTTGRRMTRSSRGRPVVTHPERRLGGGVVPRALDVDGAAPADRRAKARASPGKAARVEGRSFPASCRTARSSSRRCSRTCHAKSK